MEEGEEGGDGGCGVGGGREGGTEGREEGRDGGREGSHGLVSKRASERLPVMGCGVRGKRGKILGTHVASASVCVDVGDGRGACFRLADRRYGL
jgi:hypothetical protein